MPLPRMTTRRWMVAVAVVGLCVGLLTNRRNDAIRRASQHKLKELQETENFYRFRSLLDTEYSLEARLLRGAPTWLRADEIRTTMEDVNRASARIFYHAKMAKKWARAARRPWLPVAPDPSPPE